jgi:hypothetical protein
VRRGDMGADKNIELVRAGYAAFSAGDVATLHGLFAAVDGGRHRDKLNYGAGRLGTRGHETECLRQGFLDHRMPDPEPDPDPGYLATVGALAHCLKHALAQAVLMHSAPG